MTINDKIRDEKLQYISTDMNMNKKMNILQVNYYCHLLEEEWVYNNIINSIKL